MNVIALQYTDSNYSMLKPQTTPSPTAAAAAAQDQYTSKEIGVTQNNDSAMPSPLSFSSFITKIATSCGDAPVGVLGSSLDLVSPRNSCNKKNKVDDEDYVSLREADAAGDDGLVTPKTPKQSKSADAVTVHPKNPASLDSPDTVNLNLEVYHHAAIEEEESEWSAYFGQSAIDIVMPALSSSMKHGIVKWRRRFGLKTLIPPFTAYMTVVDANNPELKMLLETDHRPAYLVSKFVPTNTVVPIDNLLGVLCVEESRLFEVEQSIEKYEKAKESQRLNEETDAKMNQLKVEIKEEESKQAAFLSKLNVVLDKGIDQMKAKVNKSSSSVVNSLTDQADVKDVLDEMVQSAAEIAEVSQSLAVEASRQANIETTVNALMRNTDENTSVPSGASNRDNQVQSFIQNMRDVLRTSAAHNDKTTEKSWSLTDSGGSSSQIFDETAKNNVIQGKDDRALSESSNKINQKQEKTSSCQQNEKIARNAEQSAAINPLKNARAEKLREMDKVFNMLKSEKNQMLSSMLIQGYKLTSIKCRGIKCAGEPILIMSTKQSNTAYCVICGGTGDGKDGAYSQFLSPNNTPMASPRNTPPRPKTPPKANNCNASTIVASKEPSSNTANESTVEKNDETFFAAVGERAIQGWVMTQQKCSVCEVPIMSHPKIKAQQCIVCMKTY